MQEKFESILYPNILGGDRVDDLTFFSRSLKSTDLPSQISFLLWSQERGIFARFLTTELFHSAKWIQGPVYPEECPLGATSLGVQKLLILGW